MTSSQEEFRTHFGWRKYFAEQLPLMDEDLRKLEIARVVGEERNLYRLQFNCSEILSAVITGKMQFKALRREDYPAVGDWVLAEKNSSGQSVIRHILKRQSVLLRKQVGTVSDVQVLAANVDTIFITSSLNGDLNMGRLERYLTFAWESGARPVILLTKADLCADVDHFILEVNSRFLGVDVYSLSSDNYAEAQFLQHYLTTGSTSVLVGSSGVGKSTLINYLIGSDLIKTNDVREGDDKGRHTTTSRSLYRSRFGGLVIDTPGMRELQFANHEEGFHQQYADIEELILHCRYTNCTHGSEPDCAINSAIADGTLDPERYKSFKKIQGEIRHSLRRMDKVLMAEDRKQWKKRSLEARQRIKGY